MELKDFIKATLHQIVEGTVEAQKAIREHGAIINPGSASFQRDGQWNSLNANTPQNVAFDVALTTTDKQGSTEGIGVMLGSIGLGKRNDKTFENVAVTTVKFSVPLVLPAGSEDESFP